MKGGQHGNDLYGLRSQTGVKTWDRDATSTPTRQEKNGGQEGTACGLLRTGCKATIKAGVVKRYRQVCRKETRQSGREEQNLLAAKSGRGSVSLDRRGRGAAKKSYQKVVQGNRCAGYKARTEPDSKELLGAGTTKQEGRGQRESTDELKSQHGTANVGPKGASQREANSRHCGTIRGSNSWNAAVLSGWGYSAVNLVAESTPRSKNVPTTRRKVCLGTRKVEQQQERRSCLAKTNRNNAGSIMLSPIA